MTTQGTGTRIQEDDGFFESNVPRGFEERKEHVLFKFEKPGDKLEGHLVGILRTTVKGDNAVAMFFSVNGKTDQFTKIHATRQMLEKIYTGDVGRFIRIVFKGNSSIQTAGSPMKMFSIQVDTKSEPRVDLLMNTSLLEMLNAED